MVWNTKVASVSEDKTCGVEGTSEGVLLYFEGNQRWDHFCEAEGIWVYGNSRYSNISLLYSKLSVKSVQEGRCLPILKATMNWHSKERCLEIQKWGKVMGFNPPRWNYIVEYYTSWYQATFLLKMAAINVNGVELCIICTFRSKEI